MHSGGWWPDARLIGLVSLLAVVPAFGNDSRFGLPYDKARKLARDTEKALFVYVYDQT